MASLTIDSKGRSPMWICCYTTSDGRRLKKSTKIRIRPQLGDIGANGKQRNSGDAKREAFEVCLAWQRAEDMVGQGTATEQQLRRVLSETLERIGVRRIEQITARSWFESWLNSKKGIVAKSTEVAYEQMSREFLEFLGKRADSPLETVTPETISDYRDSLKKQGLAVGSIRKTIKKYLNSPFNSAWRLGKIPMNPCSMVEVESKRDKAAAKSLRGVFTTDQVKSIIKVAEGCWKNAIRTAYFTGARLQDVANFRWTDLSVDFAWLTYTQRKTGGEVTCPIHPSLLVQLKKIKRVKSPYIFPELAEKDEGGRNGLSLTFSKIMDAAGIENRVVREKREGKRSRAVRELTFHSLRHSFNSALHNAGVDRELRKKLTGHSDDRSNERYTHTEASRLIEAVELIPAI